MKRRGRPPKPTALHLVKGNPGRRDRNENEPEPELQKWAEPPAHLSDVAKAKWPEMVDLLSRNNVFTEMDVDLLAIYVEAHAIELHAFEQLTKDGWTVKSPKSGYLIASPYKAIHSNAWKTKQEIMSEFGMGPTSRTRINVNAAPRYGKKAQKSGLLDPL